MKTKLVSVISGRMLVLLSCVLVTATFLSGSDHNSFVGRFKTLSNIASTVPTNGDVNPYGVAVVKRSTGALVRDHVLVSNFNNSGNLQGTGTTIMDIAPDGTASVFAQLEASDPNVCSDGIGLTTALVVLRSGWVIVGSLPTTDGTSDTATAGCLIVLDSNGHAVENISGGPVNGPWDMTAVDGDDWAVMFVTNVLNGTVAAKGDVVNQGTVLRIKLALDEDEMPRVLAEDVIASGFPERTDPAALVIGPTGVGFSDDGTLYVADTAGNRIAAIPHALSRKTDAGIGDTVSSDLALNGPLGLAIAPNGDILVVNSNDGNLVETRPDGSQIVVMNVDSTGLGAGTLFGLAIAPHKKGIYFVNDGDNTLNLLH